MIAVEALTFAYGPGSEPVIERLTERFVPGSVTVITGPSGRGKSTLLYLVGLMLTPTDGVVRWDGVAVSGLADAARSRLRAGSTGFVFQDAVLDPSRSVLDNVMEAGLYAGMARAVARARSDELLERFGVEARATHRPGEVSGGQAQRVALCRALLTSPSLLLADEPTGNLDHASADTVWSALRDAAAAGATVVVATHDRERAAAADQVLVL